MSMKVWTLCTSCCGKVRWSSSW